MDGKGIDFFGVHDRTGKGGQKSSTVAGWLKTRRLQVLREEIEEDEHRLTRNTALGLSDVESHAREKALIAEKRQRYDELVSSKPSLGGKEKDFLAGVRKNLAEQIKSGKQPRSDCLRGSASPFVMRQRCDEKWVDARPFPGLCRANGFEPDSEGRITGNEADFLYMHISGALDEDPSVEALRPDTNDDTYKLKHALNDLLSDKVNFRS
jgi:hypothetical protein